MYKIMIVDDEENILRSLKRLLLAAPCCHEGVAYKLEVETHASPLTALERVTAGPYALVLSDYRMPEMDGAEFLKRVRGLRPDAVRMILSGFADLNGLMAAINEAQITRFIAKPWNDYELISAIGQALAYRDMMLENLRLADECRQERGLTTRESLDRQRQAQRREGDGPAPRWGPDGSALYGESSNWLP